MQIPHTLPLWKRFLFWLRADWFLLLCLSLLLFITFFPKIPLFDIIPGYIVRLRIEDIFVMLTCGVFIIQVLRKKATLATPITAILIFYTIVGILSMFNAVFIVKTVPMEMLHIGKMFLHFARRLEYFSLFFLFFNAVKNYRHVKIIVIGILIMVVGISLYGFGQKYFYWPVYSTMNREFSKGMRLVLTEYARVPSTFGGHYDMSAYLMFALTIILSLLYFTKHFIEKIGLFAIFMMGFWLLILGSSRSSFLAYLLAISVLVWLIGIYKKSIVWPITRGIFILFLSLFIMITLGDLSSRFSQLGIVKQVNQSVRTILKPQREPPKNSLAVDPLDKTDQQPIPVKETIISQVPVTAPTTGGTVKTATPTPLPSAAPNQALPPDVYKDIPDLKVVISTEAGITTTKVVEVPRVFTECTYVYGLSACIRFDTLWPRAINGFVRNPLLGSGYSTLTKQFAIEFTEAESTDNDFFRTLGEVGLLGAIGFFGPIAMFFVQALKKVGDDRPPLAQAIIFGILAGTLGMFVNAGYIDVFAASKVAFMFWGIMGVGFAILAMTSAKNESKVDAQIVSKKKKLL